MSTAMDEDCLTNLNDKNTGVLDGSFPEIFHEPLNASGATTLQSLTPTKAELETTSCNHARPVVNICTSINDCANVAKAADASEMPAQLISAGLIIISRAAMFSSNVHKWHDKLEVEWSWIDFKERSKATQKAVEQSQPCVTTDSSGFHEQASSASTLINQVIEQLTAQRNLEAVALQLAEQRAQQEQVILTQTQTMEQVQLLMSTILQFQARTRTTKQTSATTKPWSLRTQRRMQRGVQDADEARTWQWINPSVCLLLDTRKVPPQRH